MTSRSIYTTPATAPEQIAIAFGQTRLGFVLVAHAGGGLVAIMFGDDRATLREDLQRRFPKTELVDADADFEASVAQVVKYVEAPHDGLDLPLEVYGTAFQQKVWKALETIPLGKTVSYQAIADQIGSPKSVRAVAQACGANPLSLVIPCHRVVRSDGGLSGYHWGVERKRSLLDRERA